MIERKRTWPALALALLCFGWAEPARADFITYTFTAHTSSVTGQTGALDFQFNPNDYLGGSDTAVITRFTSIGGTLGSPNANTGGDVTGNLGNLPVTLTDDLFLNELQQTFTYGTSLQFTLALTTTNPGPEPVFTFTMYDGSNNPFGAIGSANFSAIEIDVDPYGNQGSPQMGGGVTGGAGGAGGGGPSPAPEPVSLSLAVVGSACLAGAAWRRRRAQRGSQR